MALREEGCWDKQYAEDLNNFRDNGDEGDVWFGKGLTKKISRFIVNKILDDKSKHVDLTDILDVGCGNTFFLSTVYEMLVEENHSLGVKLMGLDYSKNSIELSKSILEAKRLVDQIELYQCDFLDIKKVAEITTGRKFNYIVDKGTYDAICLLASDEVKNLREVKTKYVESLRSLVKDGTIFIIASCNHTEDELLELLDGDGTNFQGVGREYRKIGRIETPQIQYGGKVGSQVCCIIVMFL